jgi:hypothetical protein
MTVENAMKVTRIGKRYTHLRRPAPTCATYCLGLATVVFALPAWGGSRQSRAVPSGWQQIEVNLRRDPYTHGRLTFVAPEDVKDQHAFGMDEVVASSRSPEFAIGLICCGAYTMPLEFPKKAYQRTQTRIDGRKAVLLTCEDDKTYPELKYVVALYIPNIGHALRLRKVRLKMWVHCKSQSDIVTATRILSSLRFLNDVSQR